jgi:hypothetical protein
MFTLIVLATMTNLGSYPTQARCEAAIRGIYEQRIDPYDMMDRATLKRVVDLKMRYSAPREYRCQKV